MSETFSVIFRGDILPGHTLPDVKARMAQLFKLDDAKLAAVFSGKPVALKKDCDAATAEKMKAVLTKAGAEVEIRSNSVPVPAPKPAPAAPAAAPAPAQAPRPLPDPPPAAPIARPATPAPLPVPAAMAAGLKVAPVGMVLTDAERAALQKPPVQVKIDHISLEKRASAFMAADEKPATPKRPEIQAPDFGVAAAGGELLRPDEKPVLEELQLDLSAYQVAEVGADILPESQRAPLPVIEIQELEAGLAPVGSDMGELRQAPPPPPPKTDHLKLV